MASIRFSTMRSWRNAVRFCLGGLIAGAVGPNLQREAGRDGGLGDDLLAEDLKRSADRANGHEVLEPDDDEPDDETASDAGGSDDDDWAASIGLRSAAQFIDEYVPITYSIDGMLAEKALYFLTGRSGCGKTTISIAGGLAVANGDESILGVPVERGRVAYIAFENPDNFRQQLAIAVDAHCPAGVPDNFIVIDKDKPLENILGVLAAEARLNGDYQLVIIDSFQASFRGDDFNNNAQVLKHTRKLRRFTVEIPGCPTVLVLAHPVKNAGEDNLLPYGGNAILNEIDGNLTVWQMSDSPVTVHWQGKFRGHFDPLTFQLRRETSAKIYDKDGALLPRPVAYRVLPDHADLLQDISEDLAIKLLRAIASNPGGTQRARAEVVGAGQATVHRTLKKLEAEKLVTQTLGKWRLTPKGERLIADPIDSSKATTKKAKKAAGAKAPKGNQKIAQFAIAACIESARRTTAWQNVAEKILRTVDCEKGLSPRRCRLLFLGVSCSGLFAC